MMIIVFYVLIILLILLIGGYFFYLILLKVAKQKAEKLFQTKQQQLDHWQKKLTTQYSHLEQRKQRELNDIAEKNAELSRKQAENLVAINVAEKNYAVAQIKIRAMQKRIDQLQSELYQARKRAERLANKAKNNV